MEKRDPYDTQYAAHLYEWNLAELREAVVSLGFSVDNVYGIVAKVREFEAFMETRPKAEREHYAKLKAYLPSPWLMSFIPILYPEAAAEVLLILTKARKSLWNLKKRKVT
jgi:hypothetical protein